MQLLPGCFTPHNKNTSLVCLGKKLVSKFTLGKEKNVNITDFEVPKIMIAHTFFENVDFTKFRVSPGGELHLGGFGPPKKQKKSAALLVSAWRVKSTSLDAFRNLLVVPACRTIGGLKISKIR